MKNKQNILIVILIVFVIYSSILDNKQSKRIDENTSFIKENFNQDGKHIKETLRIADYLRKQYKGEI